MRFIHYYNSNTVVLSIGFKIVTNIVGTSIANLNIGNDNK